MPLLQPLLPLLPLLLLARAALVAPHPGCPCPGHAGRTWCPCDPTPHRASHPCRKASLLR